MRNFARYTFAAVVVGACAGALVRVATGPERIKERRNTAKQVCESGGGNWVSEAGEERCVVPDGASARSRSR